VLPQVMRLRRAVPKIPPKPSVSPRLPLYKSRPFLTRSKSTLPQMLIPLHFNFRTCNVYKNPGEGIPPRHPKVLQLVTPSRFVIPSEARTSAPPSVFCEETSAPPSVFCEENLLFPFSSASLHASIITSLHQSNRSVGPLQLTPFPAALTCHLQLAENTAALSPASVTLADTVTHNSFVCRSCKKHRGVGYTVQTKFLSFPHASPDSFVIRISAKRAGNSRRIRISKTQHFKPFRIRIYGKTGRGVGIPPASDGQTEFVSTRSSVCPFFKQHFSRNLKGRTA
jgi:hypothetical protein